MAPKKVKNYVQDMVPQTVTIICSGYGPAKSLNKTLLRRWFPQSSSKQNNVHDMDPQKGKHNQNQLG